MDFVYSIALNRCFFDIVLAMVVFDWLLFANLSGNKKDGLIMYLLVNPLMLAASKSNLTILVNFLLGKSILRKIFEGGMFRTISQPTVLQRFCKTILYLKSGCHAS